MPVIPLFQPAKRPMRGPVTTTPLTSKQEAFARAVALEGMTYADAYRAAYDTTTMAAPTVWVKASELAKAGKVRARIEALRAGLERQAYDDAGATRRHVVERLMYESLNAPQASARVRALELLGRLDFVGLFRPPRAAEVVDNRTAADIIAELRNRLTAALEKK